MNDIAINFLEVIDISDEPKAESSSFEIKRTKLHPEVVVIIGSR